ncbi:HEPN domain-containing protein [Candidatus Binatia bacterium]|nr:HEPN domain-containing protein [Candidatus Binatia bacterium]
MASAEEFLQMATADAEAGMASNIPYTICFHAQQASEKYLKAYLVSKGQQAPRTHNILELIDRCAAIDDAFTSLRPLAEDLSLFGVEIRYAPSKEEADKKCPATWSAMLRISELVRSKTDAQQ